MIDQSTADRLIQMNKRPTNPQTQYQFPSLGNKIAIPIVSTDLTEEFLLDINRGSINVLKCTYQKRYATTVILVRLDIHPHRHVNPDVSNPPDGFQQYNGAAFEDSHIHFYTEGYHDKWAKPASDLGFSNPDNVSELVDMMNSFCDYFNIVQRPLMVGVLV